MPMAYKMYGNVPLPKKISFDNFVSVRLLSRLLTATRRRMNSCRPVVSTFFIRFTNVLSEMPFRSGPPLPVRPKYGRGAQRPKGHSSPATCPAPPLPPAAERS